MSGVRILIFAVSILVSIGIHELGHFATAKWFGIKVERFFIGFGPRLWSVRRGETEYGLAAFPVGGYVRIAGMNPFEEIPPEDRSRIFKAKPKWQRAIVLAAGSFTHFVIAFGLIAVVLALVSLPDPDRPTTQVARVEEDTPAAGAGIRAGDVIVSVDGVRGASWDEFVEVIQARPGQRVEVVVERGGRTLALSALLASAKPSGERVGFLGVGPEFEEMRHSVAGAISQAGRGIGDGVYQSIVAIKRIFSPSTLGRLFSVAAGREERTIEDPATVVGIGRVVGNLPGFGDLFLAIAGLNIFLGVANLLPLPPLDGGHLAVVTYEAVRRREVDMRKLLPVSAMVVSVLMTLFVLLLYLDIVRPIPNLPG